MTPFQLISILKATDGPTKQAQPARIDEDAIKASFAAYRRRQEESVH